MKALLPPFALIGIVAAVAAAPQQPGATPVPDATPRVRSSTPRKKVSPTPPLPPDSPMRPAIEAYDAGDFERAAQMIAALDPKAMPATEARRWWIYGELCAVRTANPALLTLANQGQEGRLFADARQILTAWELAQIGHNDAARQTLKKIDDPENLDERSRRRYLALLAGMAEQENNRTAERAYLAKLVDYVGSWKSDTCQSCHENPEKYGDDVTSLDAANLWIGKRFSAILKADGDAARVRQAAQKRLAQFSGDESARLRLAYALRAEGKETEAVQELRKLDWAVFPDRVYKKPDNDIRFPGPLPVADLRAESEFMPENHVRSAADYLRAGELRKCHRELSELGAPEKLPTVLRYQVLAVKACLARLEGNHAAEADALRAMVDTVAPLATASQITLETKQVFQDWDNWWVTRRLDALGFARSAERARVLPPLTATSANELTRKNLTHYP